MSKQRFKIGSGTFMLLFLVFVLSLAVKAEFDTLDNISTGNGELMNTPDPFKTDLLDAIDNYKKHEITIIDLSKITTFTWDRLYFFPPYTTSPEIDEVVGRSWRKVCYTRIVSTDSYTLLVFMTEEEVVHCVDYPKSGGNFIVPQQLRLTGISSQASLFEVDEDGNLMWVPNR